VRERERESERVSGVCGDERTSAARAADGVATERNGIVSRRPGRVRRGH
jgi:hypothetical protein